MSLPNEIVRLVTERRSGTLFAMPARPRAARKQRVERIRL
jgi:hypothetical protein